MEVSGKLRNDTYFFTTSGNRLIIATTEKACKPDKQDKDIVRWGTDKFAGLEYLQIIDYGTPSADEYMMYMDSHTLKMYKQALEQIDIAKKKGHKYHVWVPGNVSGVAIENILFRNGVRARVLEDKTIERLG